MAVKKKTIIIPVVVAVLAGGGLYACNAMSKAAKESMIANSKYSVIPAGQNDLSKVISTTGKVIGNGTVDVTTKLSCSVSKVNVSLGDMVKEGDLLCEFDTTELQEEYDSLKAQMDNSDKKEKSDSSKNERDLEAAKAKKDSALARAQREIDKAVTARDNAYEKYNNLCNEYNAALERGDQNYDYGTVWATLEQLKSGLSTYDDAVTLANDSYKDTESTCNDAIQKLQDVIDDEAFDTGSDNQKKLDKLAEQIEQCKVYAPQSGIITALNVNEGSVPSAPSIMTIVNTDKTVIELTVKETDITKIAEGMKAKVTSKVLPGEEFTASITRIVNVVSTDVTAEGSESGYKVEVTLDETNDKLLIGMSASVDVTIEEVGEKLSVPYSGIIEEDGAEYVYVAEPADDEQGGYIAKKKKVVKGAESDFYVEVKSGEVKSGDLVIMEPEGGDLPDVSDGARVQVNEKKK
ncbi:MAG: efflux RND transporter periplasmic adaptor subunit [Ruminococcus sp.]|uniref:efflux RND transporter periplasmic adaptor subunit n=1 Tax=Ruminococcus sp. TaxID=41978 RepID=UPI0025E8B5E3|nr:efflux RND transporter periplasmic adaptor subunit [Ruminococcus sp.]MCR5541988.1 efflux RND transporter periplasmic adaptor subunit [Ruminococcus sp.]